MERIEVGPVSGKGQLAIGAACDIIVKRFGQAALRDPVQIVDADDFHH